MCMWTCKSFLLYSKGYRKEFKKNNINGSKPKKLFKPLSKYEKENYEDYVFQSDNWNDADLVRQYIQENLIDKNLNAIEKNNLAIYYTFDEDTRRTTIIKKNEFSHDAYEIGWYKNRGATNYITKNNNSICLDEYVELLNLLYS